jgi:GDP-4-dehydro-6-deoxy-D-mannose reductase
MNVLITGISGFAGSHLADYVLKNTKAKLFGTIRPGKRNSDLDSRLSIDALFPCDIKDFQSVCTVVGKAKPDIIFHLAGQSSVFTSHEQSIGTFEVNVIGTVNLVEATKACGIHPRILIVSSGEVYGGAEDSSAPPTEGSVLRPQNLYAASKVAVDYIAKTYKTSEQLDIVIARPFNHIGPRQSTSFVCASLARQFALIKKKKAEPVLKVGNTSPKRNFTDVRDIVRAYWLLGGIPNDRFFIFNICSEQIFSIGHIITMFEEISDTKVRSEADPDKVRSNDIQLVTGSNELLKKHTHWQPAYSMRQTLIDLFEYWMEKT